MLFPKLLPSPMKAPLSENLDNVFRCSKKSPTASLRGGSKSTFLISHKELREVLKLHTHKVNEGASEKCSAVEFSFGDLLNVDASRPV